MEPTPKNLHKDLRICAFCSATIDENKSICYSCRTRYHLSAYEPQNDGCGCDA